jgi:hypothetical protein
LHDEEDASSTERERRERREEEIKDAVRFAAVEQHAGVYLLQLLHVCCSCCMRFATVEQRAGLFYAAN